MTGPAVPPPLVSAARRAVTGAGQAVGVPITIVNTAAEPRVFLVSALGIDAEWLPPSSRSQAVPPGAEISATMTLCPPEGTVAARYPLLLAVQALDPRTGDPRGATVTVDLELVVDAPGQVTIAVEPIDSTAVFGTGIEIALTNAGSRAETVYLDVRAPASTSIRVPREGIEVAPHSTVKFGARAAVAHPSLFRRRSRHAFLITARGSGSARFAEGSLTARPVIGPVGTKVLAGVAVVALWLALAALVVPKLAHSTKSKQAAGASKSATHQPGGPGSGSGGPGGPGGGAGPDGGGSSAPGGAAAGATAATSVRLTGTVAGSPGNVQVSVSNSSEGNTSGLAPASNVAYKITPSALISTPQTTVRPTRVVTKNDGAWALLVPPTGLYTLTFAKAGYQEQRFQIDSSVADATKPMTVTMVPGTGSMSGSVTTTDGRPVKAATVTISDGTNVLTTSTNSTGGGLGRWSVTGLSTPSTYLVSVGAAGLGTASRLVDVAAEGSPVVDLQMSTGVATLSGTVENAAGQRVGGALVVGTDGVTTRSVTTLTQGPGLGTFVVPNLALGTWSFTVQAAGYQLQSSEVQIVAGRPTLTLPVTLRTATVQVTGSVKADGGGVLPGAGLILTNAQNSYKQTALDNGTFTFDNVAPGTYSLSAQYFGYTTSYQSVKAVVGQPAHPANFVLEKTVIVNDSRIQGFVGNAVSSSGTFGCKKAADGTVIAGCTVGFALKDRDGNPIPTTLIDKGPNMQQPIAQVGTASGAIPYTLSITPTASNDGLMPGSYTLVISSPGFIPATINVRVPLRGTANAPQVELFPANTIAGKVDTIGQINGDGLPTNTPGDNCMVAVPVDIDPSVFSLAKFGCSTATTPTDGYSLPYLATLGSQCTDNGTAEPAAGIIANDGRYTIPGLCDGEYNVVVVVGNPAYDAASTISTVQTVIHGQTLLYSPHVARKGVLQLTVGSLDTETGVTSPLRSTEVHVVCTAPQAASPSLDTTVTTSTDGTATVFGLAAGTVNCTVTLTASPASKGTTGLLSVLDDNDVDATATITAPLPPVFGEIVSAYGASSLNPVGGVTVNVTAVTSVVGTDPVTTRQPVTTNANGCFAVVPEGAPAPAQTPVGCGTLAKENILQVGLTSRSVTVDVSTGVRTDAVSDQPMTLTALGTAAIGMQAVRATPVSTADVSFTSVPGGLSLDNASVKVTGTTAAGSGTVTASVNSSGHLIWSDSNIGQPERAWQGSYTLALTVPGFQPVVSTTLSCGLSTGDVAPLVCTLSDPTVQALGSLTGTVRAPVQSVPHSTTTVVPLATVIARRCTSATACPTAGDPAQTLPDPANPQTGACPTVSSGTYYSTTADGGGNYTFLGTGNVRYMVPGQYQLIACAGGLITTYVDNVVVAGGTNPPVTITMSLLGGISGVVSGSNNPTTLPAVTITLRSCPTASTCTTVATTTTAAGNGAFAFTSVNGAYFLDPGQYLLSYSAAGYTPQNDVPITVKSGDNSGDVTLGALGGLSGTVTRSGTGDPIGGAKVTYTQCTGSTAATCTGSSKVTTADGSGFFQFSGNDSTLFLAAGSYVQVKAEATSYAPAVTDPPLLIKSGDNDASVGLDLLGAVSGTVNEKSGVAPVIAKATVTAVACADGQACTSTVAGSDKQATTDASGNYTFTQNGATNIFALQYWQFTATATGYQDQSLVRNVVPGANTVAFSLTPQGSVSGTLSSTGSPSDNLSGGTVTAVPCTTAAVPVCSGTPQIATADVNGHYSFTGTASDYVFNPGPWKFTASAFGYLDTSTPVTIKSGPQTVDIALPVRQVTQPLQVKISGSTAYTQHAVVTLVRKSDPTNKSIPTTRSGTIYTPDPLPPATYTATIDGDGSALGQSILETSTDVTVPLIDVDAATGKRTDTGPGTAPTVTLAATVLKSTINGTVAGRKGPSSTVGLSGIRVDLLLADGVTRATDLADNPISTTSGDGGTFSFAGVPNGAYTVRINGADPATGIAATNGWGTTTTAQFSVGYGSIQNLGTIALDPVKAAVDVVVKYDVTDPISGATPTLGPDPTVASWAPLAPTATTVGSGAAPGTVTYSFTAVPNGCWAFDLGLPTGHTGTIALTSSNGSCSSGYFAVPPSGAKTTAAYTLDEHVLTVTSTVTPNPADTGTAPTVRLGVTSKTTSKTVFPTTAVTDGTVTTLYLPGDTYTVALTLDPSTPRSTLVWKVDPAVDVDVTSGSKATTVKAVEAALVSLTVTHYNGGKTGSPISVSVRCDQSQNVPNGCGTLGTVPALTASDTGTGASFANLAQGNWTVEITGTLPDNTDGSAGGTFTEHQSVTLTSGGANTTTNTWLAGPAP